MAFSAIAVQEQDFDLAQEYQLLREQAGDAGAVVTFTGLVREWYEAGDDLNAGQASSIKSLFLEHYPGMTERCLEAIQAEAAAKWPLLACKVIHRIGELEPGDQIVFVGTASAHRHAAFDAAQFIMDYLKSNAPFWKKQSSGSGSDWIESRVSDADAIKRWQ